MLEIGQQEMAISVFTVLAFYGKICVLLGVPRMPSNKKLSMAPSLQHLREYTFPDEIYSKQIDKNFSIEVWRRTLLRSGLTDIHMMSTVSSSPAWMCTHLHRATMKE